MVVLALPPGLSMATGCCLAEEMMVEILLRLPVKSLLRFQSVSRSWLALIRSPSFNTTYIAHRKSKPPAGYLFCLTQYSYYETTRHTYRSMNSWISFYDESFGNTLHAPKVLPEDCYSFIGSCNGLVCLTDDALKICGDYVVGKICIWNPTIQKVKVLPESVIAKSGDWRNFIGYHAFGFDPNSDDYKVVRIIHALGPGADNTFRIEIYSLNTNSWRLIGSFPISFFILVDYALLFVNGISYWGAVRNSDSFSVQVIGAFDIVNEALYEIPLPRSIPESHCIMPAKFSEDSLAIIDSHEDSQLHDIWVLQDSNKWTKKFTISSYLDRENIFDYSNYGNSFRRQLAKDLLLPVDDNYVDKFAESLLLLEDGGSKFALSETILVMEHGKKHNS